MMQVIEICGCKGDIWSISKSYKRMNIAPVKLIYIAYIRIFLDL